MTAQRRKIRPMGYWTFERVCRNASAFETRSEFQRRSNTAYVIAYRRGWLDAACAHMTAAGNRMMRFVYTISRPETKEVYVGLTANPKRRYAVHKSNPKAAMKAFIAGPHFFTTITPEPIPAADAAEMERSLVGKFQSDGWIVLNSAAAGGLGGRHDAIWTIDALMAEAVKYPTRLAMRRGSPSAYAIASRHRVIDRIFADHPSSGLSRSRKRNGHWTRRAIFEAAKSVETRQEFRRRHSGAYIAAHRLGYLDAAFADHPNKGYLLRR